MLTCEICGEEVMLEEDMKTHLLLVHLENELHCPLCSLSGVSYDELCFHITSAHPEEQHGAQDPARFTSSKKHQTSQPRSAEAVEDAASTSESARRCSGTTAESKQQQQQRSPSKEEKLLSCPMCALVCSSASVLQEHVELHLQDQCSAEELDALKPPPVSNGSVESRFDCPMCSVACSDSFSLQEHVELHLDQGAAGSGAAGSPGSDLKLARRLQREEEARQEKEDFKKLQEQFGLNGRGGYRRQMERTMERAVARGLMSPADFHCKRAEMMETLASGVDDGTTRTQGVVRALYDYYQTECRDSVRVWLSTDTDHYCSSEGDRGWGCGYRNLQILLSALHRIDTYSNVLQALEKTVPSIPRLQSMIEEAWKEGLDPQGASHFNQRLQGTRAWIGATEIYALLTSLRIRSRIIDFHTPTGPGGTHPRLFDWVKQYYCQSSTSSRLAHRLIQTSLPPLYLQHQGHSRSIVGLEQKKNGSLCLLLLDPGCSASDARKLLSRDTVSTAVHRMMRKFPRGLKHKQYQVVAAQEVLSAEEKQISILSSRTLRAERIP